MWSGASQSHFSVRFCLFGVVLQRLDSEELTVTSTSMQTVERINQGVPKPSSQVNSHTGALTHSLTHTHTHTHTLTAVSSPPAGKSYFVCDHQRSVFLFLCSLNRTCSLTGYPCSSYSDYLEGRCLQCEAFKPAPCPVLGRCRNSRQTSTDRWLWAADVWSPVPVSPAGYDVSQWRDTLLKLGQTKVFFSTTATLPYRSESDAECFLL